jgi:hypothetical protein
MEKNKEVVEILKNTAEDKFEIDYLFWMLAAAFSVAFSLLLLYATM